MNGTFGRPFRGVPLPLGEQTIHRIVSTAGKVHFFGGPLLARVRRGGFGPRLLKTLGLISQAFDEQLFSEMLSDFETIRFDHYMKLLAELSRHDAEAVLPLVHAPTLVIAGGRDRITPSYSARRIAQQIPGAEYFVLPRATHYAAVEYPRQVVDRILDFFRAHPAVAPHASAALPGA
jgi:3-oxoadipate enol-lactonase